MRGYVIFGFMILLWIWLIIWAGNLSWSGVVQVLRQMQISWGTYFVIAWSMVVVLAFRFSRRSVHGHVFYDNVAKIYERHGKRPYRWIIPDDIEYMEIEKVDYKQEVFYMITVRFKSLVPKFLGRPSNFKFGVDEQGDIQKLVDWTKERGIPLEMNRAQVACSIN